MTVPSPAAKPPTPSKPSAATPDASPLATLERARDVVTRARDVLTDYARRVWVSSGEDDIFFLASGIAFNIMLAAVPFVLLFITGLAYALGLSPDDSLLEVRSIFSRFLPASVTASETSVYQLLEDVVRSRDSLGAWSAVTFIWFSTRLFGSLRAVLAEIFDIETDRGIVSGKWFDIRITVISSFFLVVYAGLSTYLALASTRGISLLVTLGLREETMGSVEYVVGRCIAFGFIVAVFWALYRFLPNRRIRWQQALVGALSSSVLFELARNLWTAYTRSFDPGSIYSGTLYAVVSLVFWVYYAALIFIVGGEVSQAHELRRVRQRQRETFEN